MIKEVKESEILDMLRNKISYTYSQKDLATDYGVSKAYISAVLSGTKRPSQKILDAINVERVETTSYVLKPSNKRGA